MVEGDASHDKAHMKKQFLEQGGLNIGTNNAFLVFKRAAGAEAQTSKPSNIIQTSNVTKAQN